MAENTQRPGKLVHPRLPDALHEQVTAYAAANNRSITNAVVHLIERGLQAEAGIHDTTRFTPPDVHTR